MKKIIVLFSMAFLSIAAKGQTTLSLQPNGTVGKDAEIFSCVPCGYSTRNFGTIAENCAIAWTKNGSSHNIRSLIQFDLSSIPATATIQSATLSLYWAPGSDEGKHYGFFGSNKAYLQRITHNWDESTVTWNNQPATTTLNRVSISGSTSSTQNYPSINVTQLVRDMVANPTTSFGFMLKLQHESVYKKLVFASSDHSTASIRPKLVVVFSSHSPAENSTGEEMRTLPTTQALKVFPNPAKGTVNLSINSADIDQAYVSIYDINGREMIDQVYQVEPGKNQFSFETASWSRGLYMIIVKTGGEMVTEKLLLE